MSCGVGRRRSSDPELLWLWRRLAATAPVRPLAWEPPYAVGAAQEMAKKQKEKEKEKEKVTLKLWLWCNRIGSVLGALGPGFSPRPGTVG